MSHETPNALAMQRKRGRPAKTPVQPKHDGNYEAQDPSERLVALVLRRGWWPYEDTIYRDATGERQTYRTPVEADGTVNEMGRKRNKFEAGTRIEVPQSIARTLVEEGKATLDVGM